MLVRSRSTASTVSCLRWNCRSDRSSLIAEKSRPTLTCVTGSVASARLQPHRSGGRMGSGSGGAVYQRFIAQCRLKSVGFTTRWVVCTTTSFKNTPSEYLRVRKLKRRVSETQPSALLSAARLSHSPAQRRDGMTSHTSLFVKKKSKESGQAINGGSRERGLWEGPISKRYPDF